MPMFFLGAPYAGSGTYATAPAANSVQAGAIYFATDLGEYGTMIQSTGLRWRPFNGRATLKTLGIATGNIANVETIVMQQLLPAASWQTNDTLRIWLAMTKSGAVDAGVITVRIGTLGTTADTAITGLSAFQVMAASGLSSGSIFDIKLMSATSAQKVGAAGGSLGSYTSASAGTAASAATAITSAAANALYVSVGILSGGATNTVALQSGSIELVN